MAKLRLFKRTSYKGDDYSDINPDFLTAEQGRLSVSVTAQVRCAMCGVSIGSGLFCSTACKDDYYFEDENQDNEYTAQAQREE